MTDIIKTVSLYNQTGNSDKVYVVNLVQVTPSTYQVIAFNGRRGSTLIRRDKNKTPVSFAEASKTYNDVVNEKKRDNYFEGSDVNGVVVNLSSNDPDNQQKNSSGLMPQLLNPIYIDEAMNYINDDAWMMQEKFDGHRLMTQKVKDNVVASNKLGFVTSLASTINDGINHLNTVSITLDGEGIGDHYFIFDVLEINGQDLRQSSAVDRMAALQAELNTGNGYLHLVETAYTKEEKLALYLSVMDNGGEGVVLKRKDSRYTPGRPNSGGNQIKLKFIESASCVVIGENSNKRSVSFGLYMNDKLVEHGNVSIPSNHEIPKTGDVVEIRYLYAMRNGSLIQPVYLGVRTDIEQLECDVSQLKYKKELKVA